MIENWNAKLRESIRPSPHETILGGWLLILFLGTFVLASALWDIVPKLRAKEWVAAPARVVSTEIYDRSGAHGHSWCPWITYQYDAASRHYISKNRTSAMISDSGCNINKALVEEYLTSFPAGSALGIHYDPGAPGRAAIDIEDVSWFDITFLIMAFAIFAYSAYIIRIARSVLRKQALKA
jgi:hypothetical protein